MAFFVVYDNSTGRITRSGQCPETMIQIQCGAGESVIETDDIVSNANSYVDIESTPPEIVFLGEPEDYEVLDIEQKCFVIDRVEMAQDIRSDRRRMLEASDWTQVPDVAEQMTAEKRQAWKEYRQALRDITDQDDFPESVIWPVQPK